MDQRCDANTTGTKSKRWTKKAFCWMIDVARVNAQTILALNLGKDPRKTDSFQFGWDLALSLLLPHLQRRRGSPGLQRELTTKMDTILKFMHKEVPVAAVPQRGGDGNCWELCLAARLSDKEQRCPACIKELPVDRNKQAKGKLSKQKTQCQMCETLVCKNHSVQICKDCSVKLVLRDDIQPADAFEIN